MDTVNDRLAPPGPIAWRVDLRDDAAPAAGTTLRRPFTAQALRLPAHVAEVLRETPDGGGFVVLQLPSGQATPYELQAEAEAWASADGIAAAEVLVRSVRVLWRPGRAVCTGPAADSEEVIAGLVHFTRVERALAALEAEIDGQWAAWQDDLPLTHGVGRRDLSRQRHVNAMTAAAHGYRMRFVRLEAALESPSADLPPLGRRVFSELVLLADALSRLRALDDAIEIGQDLYDTANDRLLEYSYFRREYVIEIFILAVLMVELAATAVQIGLGLP
ncbi:hypothetical protein GWK16_03245 [Roseomonas sp. JC162]|uniref:DUF155 domain-containing protein n=1 Tax=Neoroseomonas marina TaxID=1232220 RepID=A0A848E9L7_9PROT|nr:hypothetical protein [Neoroseomonas marina]NMJ40239.1 hypothetical protein [Neoroseomonas marina]